jgi:hypothetical protein
MWFYLPHSKSGLDLCNKPVTVQVLNLQTEVGVMYRCCQWSCTCLKMLARRIWNVGFEIFRSVPPSSVILYIYRIKYVDGENHKINYYITFRCMVFRYMAPRSLVDRVNVLEKPPASGHIRPGGGWRYLETCCYLPAKLHGLKYQKTYLTLPSNPNFDVACIG